MATICMHHVAACLAGIQAKGVQVDPLLIRAGINPQLMGDTHRRIHTDQVARLFRIIQLELNDEFMGFTSGKCKNGAFKVMCDLVQHAGSLGELINSAAELYRLVCGEISIVLDKESNNAVLSIKHNSPECDPQHFLREFLLVIWHRFPSWYIGEAIRLRETRFGFEKPLHHSELAIMFPGKLSYGHDLNQLVFDASYLDKPLVRSRQELESFVRHAPADVMTIPGSDNTLEKKIERIVMSVSSERLLFPRLDAVAQKLGLSPQTLYRQLKANGTSYQKIKDDIRREAAIRKLVNERQPIEKVSEFVGFSEARSFTRAFRQWTGMSPQRYRKSFST